MQHAVFFRTVPLADAALDPFLARVHAQFLLRATAFGGVRGAAFGGEAILDALADGPAERARLAAWLRAQPEVVDAYPAPAVGRVWP